MKYWKIYDLEWQKHLWYYSFRISNLCCNKIGSLPSWGQQGDFQKTFCKNHIKSVLLLSFELGYLNVGNYAAFEISVLKIW
jgi:hypothetical protein